MPFVIMQKSALCVYHRFQRNFIVHISMVFEVPSAYVGAFPVSFSGPTVHERNVYHTIFEQSLCIGN
jgi:hypothetical protein